MRAPHPQGTRSSSRRPSPPLRRVAAAGFAAAVIAATSCGPSTPPARPGARPAGWDGGAAAAPVEPGWSACPEPAGPAAVPREEVREFLDRGHGIPDFLARLRTAPVLDRPGPDGRFVGFRIVAIDPELRCAVFGIREGDIVTAINGHGIETPDDAVEIWEGLYTATRITVSFLRGGIPQEASVDVTDVPVAITNDGVSRDAAP